MNLIEIYVFLGGGGSEGVVEVPGARMIHVNHFVKKDRRNFAHGTTPTTQLFLYWAQQSFPVTTVGT